MISIDGTITVLTPSAETFALAVSGLARPLMPLLTTWATTTVTVDTSSTTAYRGVSPPSFSGLAVGDRVQVSGTQAGTDTVSATLVMIVNPSPPPRHHRHPGPVYGHHGR
ncbi:MAG TPA: DUF5666 domain-containing protein [Acidimicrobiales bacterium]|nr:DUF5666 domain-containing protein [Acidimicrobiales bacterium]